MTRLIGLFFPEVLLVIKTFAIGLLRRDCGREPRSAGPRAGRPGVVVLVLLLNSWHLRHVSAPRASDSTLVK